MMKISVLSLSGNEVASLDLHPDSTLGDLSRLVEQSCGVPAWRQRLVRSDGESPASEGALPSPARSGGLPLSSLNISVLTLVLLPPFRAATASKDGTARIWSLESSACLAVCRGHEGDVTSVAFSPDGLLLLTSSSDGTARLWNTEDGSCIRVLNGHEDAVPRAVFSEDGAAVVTASEDRTARLWCVASGECVQNFTGHRNQVFCAVFSPKEFKWEPPGEQHSPDSVVPGLYCRYVATASEDWTAKLFCVATGRCLRSYEQHRDGVIHVAFSAQGTWLLTMGWDGAPRVWDVASGECVLCVEEDSVLMPAAFTPDGGSVFTAASCCDAKLVDIVTGEERLTYHYEDPDVDAVAVNDVAFLSGDGGLLMACWDGTTKVWSGGSEPRVLYTMPEHEGEVNSVRVTPDGTLALTCSDDCTAKLWSIESGECLQTFEHDEAIMMAVISA